MAVDAQTLSAPGARSTFIRVAEIWVPDRERKYLEFGGGVYGDAHRFGAASRRQIFGRGEGLPGRVWENGAPVVLNDFGESSLRRTRSAHAAGLTSAIALPVFAGEFITSVLILFCGDDADHVGAIELWRARRGSVDMSLVDAHYGTTNEAFEFASRRTVFRKGVGLPGTAWAGDEPFFLEDLGKSNQFLRADAAQRVGVNRGLAIPCPRFDGDYYVLTFLSALGTPIARRFEIWKPDHARSKLVRTDGFCDSVGRLSSEAVVERGYGALGCVWITGVPRVSEHAPAELAEHGTEIAAAGLRSVVTLPLVRDGRLVSVVAWYF